MQEKSKQEEQKSTKKIQKQKSSNSSPSPSQLNQQFKRKLSQHCYKKKKCDDDEKSYFVSFSGEIHMHMQEETYDLHEINSINKKMFQLTFDLHNLNIQELHQEQDDHPQQHVEEQYSQYDDDYRNTITIESIQDGYN